uniref:Neuromedin-S n=1 Tax=Chrysemys picta bellii TaxID=8478 RepID=A0A8C3FIV2_CHRPI
MLRSWQNNQSLSLAGRNRWLKMKQHPSPFPLIFALYCFCALQFTSGFPQPVSRSMDAPDIPKSELALCFSQWTELSNQPQISSKVMDLCNAIFNSMQIEEVRSNDFLSLKKTFPTFCPTKQSLTIIIIFTRKTMRTYIKE